MRRNWSRPWQLAAIAAFALTEPTQGSDPIGL
jgi:hypothetical protein